MKQILQNMRDGKTTVQEIPVPGVKRNCALVKTMASLVSAGTERMLVEFAEKNLVAKATSRPDLVKQVLSKAKKEGILPTIEAAFNKLDQPMPLGYSSAGIIEETGRDLVGFQSGDRVACAGGGYAVHAEYGVIPQNLLVHLPDNVDFESGAFATLGAIALQGFRLANPQLGESVCIIGLGLLGLLAVQIAKAAGCSVFGIDLDQKRVALARSFGIKAVIRADCESSARSFTSDRGFDHILICADTHSNDPVELAGLLVRDHGTVIAVGAFGMDLPRKIYYEKELSFKVSRSYGPGRYDSRYEEAGQDYPYGYVRWTEGRNIEAFVNLMAAGTVDVKPLITHRFEIDKAEKAYELITGKSSEPFLGVVLTYPGSDKSSHQKTIELLPPPKLADKISVGVLGAGNYAQAVFLPAIQKTGDVNLAGIASASGLSATHAARKFGFGFASSDENQVLNHSDINTVVILTRHNQHARQVITALQNGKNVYCEKPLAINENELQQVEELLTSHPKGILTVGFNRRFAPFAVRLKEFIQQNASPMVIDYRINAGFLPANHWTQDPSVGGGRIIGEGCHFIDFCTFLTGQKPATVQMQCLPAIGTNPQDSCLIALTYPDGSLATIRYLANGNKNFPKERVEVFTGGRIGILDDFRNLELVTETKITTSKSRFAQDKGHQAAWQSFKNCISGGKNLPIPYEQLIAVTRVSFAAITSASTGEKVVLND
jgi:predicted dehydrogenase/threonine dehydrogenase-like Zn-dependent dehydrogenase